MLGLGSGVPALAAAKAGADVVWAERVGRDTRLAQLMTAKGCGYSLVGNPWCVADPPPVVTAQTPVCNKAYHEWATSTFCTPGANASVTVGQAAEGRVRW